MLILADDLGWKDVSCNGSAYRTPHIDRLAASGLRFTRAYAAAPSCSPTRAALLTGLSPARLGLTRALRIQDYKNEGKEKPTLVPWSPIRPYPTATRLPAGVPTFADELRDAGYETAFIGKWHVGRIEDGPAQHGFERASFVGVAGGTGYFPPYSLYAMGPTKPGEYLTDRLTDEAVAFLRREHARPFCLVLAHFAVHAPIRAKPELERARAAELPQGGPQGNATYAAMLWSLDESVGRVLAALDERDLAQDTLVLFTSDNGPSLAHGGEALTTTAPLRGGKLELYEGGLRVPLIARWPGRVPAGETCAVPVVSMDLHPTILGAAGLAPRSGLDGIDLAPFFAAGTAPARERLYWFVPHRDAQAAIRAGDWKLVHWFEGPTELYDLARDEGEERDLAAAEPERVTALRAELFGWIQASGAKLPEPNPHYDPSLAREHDDEDE